MEGQVGSVASSLCTSLPGGARIASKESPAVWSSTTPLAHPRPQHNGPLPGQAESSEEQPMQACVGQGEPPPRELYPVPRNVGFTGLSNLGNTCFMSCILQALGNITELRDYFLNKYFLRDINKENPLGTGGQLARAFYVTLKNLWSGELKTYAPNKLKTIIAKRAPQFVGFMQHDAHEFMAFFLDTLHEDLNRIVSKPTFEVTADEGCLDYLAAERSWNLHKSRNNSFIVDRFHGMYKSELTCPSCKKESVTFDPFLFLPVPLPKLEKIVTVSVFCRVGTVEPTQINVPVPERATGDSVLEYVGKIYSLPPARLRLLQIKSGCIVQELFSHTLLPPVTSSLSLILYETLLDAQNETRNIVVLQIEAAKDADKVCAHCGITSSDPGVKIRRCAKCRRSGYCSQDCQKLNWANHKLKCRHAYIGCPFVVSVQRCGTNYDKLAVWLYKCAAFSVSVSEIKLEHFERQNIDEKEPADHPAAFFSALYPFEVSLCYDSDMQSPIRLKDRAWPSDLKCVTHIIIEWLPGVVSEVKLPNQTGKLYKPKIQDCIQLFTEPEVLATEEAWYCPRCKRHQQATKKLSLWQLPDILIIQLKRFSFRNCIWRDKIDRVIEFPVKGLDLGEFCIGNQDESPLYDLFAVVNHHGGLLGGHYTSFVHLTEETGADSDLGWRLCDDSQVTTVQSSNEIVADSSYVLFYHRQNRSIPGIGSENLVGPEYEMNSFPCSKDLRKNRYSGTNEFEDSTPMADCDDKDVSAFDTVDTMHPQGGIAASLPVPPEINHEAVEGNNSLAMAKQPESTKSLPYTDMDAVD